MAVAMKAIWRLRAKRRRISSKIGAPVHIDLPRSRRARPAIQVVNCLQRGWSSPSRVRSLSRVSFWTKLSPAKRSSTMSPGTTRIRKKMSVATPTIVGIINRMRLAT